jgi:hypothetical protein
MEFELGQFYKLFIFSNIQVHTVVLSIFLFPPSPRSIFYNCPIFNGLKVFSVLLFLH